MSDRTPEDEDPATPRRSVPGIPARPFRSERADNLGAGTPAVSQANKTPGHYTQNRGDDYGGVSFASGSGLLGLAVRGYFLTFVTLGIYRFWYLTELRRHFWSRTVVQGSGLEYTGRGLEIFIGFLIALAVLLPLNGIGFWVSLSFDPTGGSGPFLLAPVYGILILFAFYRSRRYRLNRTLWRGLPVHQAGAGWAYAFRAAGWIVLGVLTLGLTVPFAEADLYRYRIERMHLGTVPFRFEGSWRQIARPYAVVWTALFVPMLLLLIVISGSGALSDGLPEDPAEWFGPDGSLPPALAGLLGLGLFIWIAVPFLVFPYYWARRVSAFFSATTLAGVQCHVRFPARTAYRIYIVYLLAFALGFTALMMIAGILSSLIGLVLSGGSLENVEAIGSVFVWVGIFAFVVVLPAVSGILGLFFLQKAFWERLCASVTILNPAALDELAGRIESGEGGFGAGFADAMDVGDFEVGL